MGDCLTCELTRRRDDGNAPPWDLISRTAGWDVVHAYGTSVEGWMVLVLRRHATAVADLTDGEAAELGALIKRVSRALHATVDCAKTYVVQFAEHPQHPHVHVHVIPRARDLSADRRGPAIFEALGVAAELCVSEQRMNEIALQVQGHLGNN